MVARILGLKRFISRKLYRFPDLITSWLDENNVDPNFRTSIESIDDDLLVKIKNLYAEDDKLLHSLGVL